MALISFEYGQVMNQQPFIPVNQLEEQLQRAAVDPGVRPAFIRTLLESDVFFLTPNPPENVGQRVLEENMRLELVHWEGKNGHFVPFFTSQERLQMAVTSAGGTYGFIALNAKSAFEMLTQNPVPAVMNPGCQFGKEFLQPEMQQLVDGTFFEARQHVVKAATRVLIGQPANYPQKLVNALKSLFAQNQSVAAAFLAQVHYPESTEPPHITIGIECPGAMPAVAPEAVAVAREVMRGGEIVDFIEVGRDGSLDDYFKKQTQPFYTRAASKPRWKFW